MMATMLTRLTQARLVAIFRGNFIGRWNEYGSALLENGITVMEITLNSEGAGEGLRTLRNSFGDRIILGAGTVLTAEQANQVIDLGAEFVVAPDTDEAVIKICNSHHIPVIPGAYTPTEIKRAYHLGATMVKLFPATTPEYIKAVRAPLDYIPIMATGGINADNAAAFLKAGASALGIGSSLVTAGITSEELAARASQFVTAVNAVEPVLPHG